MLIGAALALAIAAIWTLLSMVVGVGIGRAASNREWERRMERELRRRSGIAELRLVSAGRLADADEPVMHEHSN